MQLRSLFGLAGLVIILGVAPASASPITFNATYDPVDPVLFANNGAACVGSGSATLDMSGGTHCQSLAFSFAWPGFDTLTDVVTAGTLTLTFYDDQTDVGNGSESVDISFDSLLASSGLLITSGGTPMSPSFNVAGSLQDGLLNVLLTLGVHNRGNNDFFFDRAALSAEGTRTSTSTPPGNDLVPVPEPASLALFGLAMMGAASRLRRRA